MVHFQRLEVTYAAAHAYRLQATGYSQQPHSKVIPPLLVTGLKWSSQLVHARQTPFVSLGCLFHRVISATPLLSVDLQASYRSPHKVSASTIMPVCHDLLSWFTYSQIPTVMSSFLFACISAPTTGNRICK
jgi:hypothetical protein